MITETRTTSVEPGNRIQLPAEWATSLGLRGVVLLNKTSDGILIRPSPKLTWDEIFATKLTIGQVQPESEEFEVTGDDLLF